MIKARIIAGLTRRLVKLYFKIIKFSPNEISVFLEEILREIGIGVTSDHKKNGELLALNYIKNKTDGYLEVFDVGANNGDYSYLLREIFPNAKIHAFEPLKKVFDKLLIISDKAQINAHNFGFSNENKSQTIYFNSNSLLSSLHDRDLRHVNMAFSQSEIVQLKTIDSFCAENNIKKIDFLKLDIEGHELRALNGAKNLIDNGNIRFIQFEFGGCDIDAKVYFRDFYYFFKDKYHIYRIHPNGLTLINKYSEYLEQFTTTNYLVELK